MKREYVPVPTVDRCREYVRGRDVYCPACDYNLRDQQSTVCPECGRGIDIPVWFDSVEGTESQRMARFLQHHDLTCRKCRTSLYRHTSNVCPTCGTSYMLQHLVDRVPENAPPRTRTVARTILWVAAAPAVCAVVVGLAIAGVVCFQILWSVVGGR